MPPRRCACGARTRVPMARLFPNRAIEDLRRDPEIATALASGAVLGLVPTGELAT